jgi:hypothetical protein
LCKVNEHRVNTIKQTLKTKKGRKNNPEKGRKNIPEKGGKNNCINDMFSLSACLSTFLSPSISLPPPLSLPQERETQGVDIRKNHDCSGD